VAADKGERAATKVVPVESFDPLRALLGGNAFQEAGERYKLTRTQVGIWWCATGCVPPRELIDGMRLGQSTDRRRG
jgi:hypothetical protein